MQSSSVAIVGTGMVAEVHGPAVLASGAGLHGVLVSSATRTEETARSSGAPGFANMRNLRQPPEVDVVHTRIPNALHYGMACVTLRAGKHVVYEKPTDSGSSGVSSPSPLDRNRSSASHPTHLPKEPNLPINLYP